MVSGPMVCEGAAGVNLDPNLQLFDGFLRIFMTGGPSIGQDVSTVQAQLPEGARVIPPDSVVTQDYRPGRVNVDIDAGGLITRIWCG